MKRAILALALALALCLGLLPATALAAGEVGTIRSTGWTVKEVVPCKYDYIGPFSEGLAAVVLDKKCGYIDTTGKEVIPCIYGNYHFSYEYAMLPSFSEGMVAVQLDDKWGFVDATGKEIAPCKYDFVRKFSDGLAAVMLDDKWGFINTTGEEIIPCQYDQQHYFYDGLALVRLGGKCGFIDVEGKEVTPIQYEDAYSFSEGLAAVKLNGKWGFIDATGQEVIPAQYDDVYLHADQLEFYEDDSLLYRGGFYGGLTAVMRGDKWGFIDTAGEMVVPYQYESIDGYRDGMWGVYDRQGHGFLRADGQEITPCQYYYVPYAAQTLIWYYFGGGLAAVERENGKWGYVGITGEVVPCQYDFVSSDFSDGFGRVQLNGKFGLVDINGQEIAPCQYDFVNGFFDGLAVLKDDYKFGYIDTTGKVVVPCKYETAGAFSDGLAIVHRDGFFGYIDTTGEEVISLGQDYEGAGGVKDGMAIVTDQHGKSGVISITKPEPYTVTVSDSQHGTVTVDPTSGQKGTKVTLTVTPDAWYTLDTLTVTQADGTAVPVAADNTFTMPSSDVTVIATFKLIMPGGKSGTMLEPTGQSLGWAVTGTGELSIDGELDQGEAVLAACYDQDGRFVGLRRLDAQHTNAQVDQADELRLFWLDAKLRPIAPKTTVWGE